MGGAEREGAHCLERKVTSTLRARDVVTVADTRVVLLSTTPWRMVAKVPVNKEGIDVMYTGGWPDVRGSRAGLVTYCDTTRIGQRVLNL